MNMEPIVTIAVAIVGVATLAVLFSKKANTAGVIQAAGSAFSGALNAATSPITGGSSSQGLAGLQPLGFQY
jgi:hypothetical protein